MALDRYSAMCKPQWRKFRVIRFAVLESAVAWTVAVAASIPIYRSAIHVTSPTFEEPELTINETVGNHSPANVSFENELYAKESAEEEQKICYVFWGQTRDFAKW